MSRDISVTVVCSPPCINKGLFNIRKWHMNNPLAQRCIRQVQSANTLADALAFVSASPKQSILVTIGFYPSEIFAQTSIPALAELEVINCPQILKSQIQPELAEQPTASLLESKLFINVQDPLPAIRKSLLRLCAKETLTVRELLTKEDFQKYFSLRYRVWKQMNYLPAKQDCPKSALELNFTDQTAYPIGAFKADGALIGCARLVFALGYNTPYIHIIEKCLTDSGDPKLQDVFKYPAFLIHPFDLLESFDGFGNYFQRLVRENIRNAEVSRVIVDPEQRHQGLGEILVDSLVTLARRKQVKILFLACHDQLQPFYERCGFKVLSGLHCESFAGVNAPAIVMTRDLRR